MILIEALLLGLGFSLIALYLAYSISRIKFFQEAFEFLATYSSEPIGKDKRSMRKLRKIKMQLDRAKRRLMLLFFVHLAIFMLSYTALISTTYLVIPMQDMIVRIPIGIPLISNTEDGYYITHILFIVFIGFMAPSYLFARIVKMTQPAR